MSEITRQQRNSCLFPELKSAERYTLSGLLAVATNISLVYETIPMQKFGEIPLNLIYIIFDPQSDNFPRNRKPY